MARDTQPYKFCLNTQFGAPIEGGAETAALCKDHILHCLRADQTDRKIAKQHAGSRHVYNFITSAYYLGKFAEGEPKLVTL